MLRCSTHVLSGLGANEHPEGSLAVGALPKESLYLSERPEKHQVSVYGKQFPSHHEAGHLETEPCFRHIRYLHRLWGICTVCSGDSKYKVWEKVLKCSAVSSRIN